MLLHGTDGNVQGVGDLLIAQVHIAAHSEYSLPLFGHKSHSVIDSFGSLAEIQHILAAGVVPDLDSRHIGKSADFRTAEPQIVQTPVSHHRVEQILYGLLRIKLAAPDPAADESVLSEIACGLTVFEQFLRESAHQRIIASEDFFKRLDISGHYAAHELSVSKVSAVRIHFLSSCTLYTFKVRVTRNQKMENFVKDKESSQEAPAQTLQY